MYKNLITMGDPGGISPEILTKYIKLNPNNNYFIIGSSYIIKKNLSSLNMKIDFLKTKDELIKELKKNRLKKGNIFLYDPFEDINFLKFNKIQKDLNKNIEIGKVSKINGILSEKYLEVACEIIKENLNIIDINLITLPLNKKSVSYSKPGFIGHTEYIANYFNINNPTMILFNENIAISLVTTHIPILELNKYINKENFESTLKNTINFYSKMDLKKGIGVLSLNPHASDNGAIGDEEEWINKSISKYNENNFIEGPIPSDTAFSPYYNKEFSIFIAFYHDQGLIPFKAFSKGQGANITFGLPFLRISPDHGTAFNIVNKDIAKTTSLEYCFKIIKKYKG